MEKIFDIRFIVPPILTLILVFLFSPSYFLYLLQQYRDYELVIVSIPLILSLGVIISSIVNFILICFNSRSSEYNKDEKQILKEFFLSKEDIDMNNNDKKDSDVLELGSWLVLNNLDNRTADQIHKRWNWAVAGFNSCLSVILSFIIIIFFSSILKIIPQATIFWKIVWICLIIFLFFIFFCNAVKNLKSVKTMDRILLRNYKQILNSKSNGRPLN